MCMLSLRTTWANPLRLQSRSPPAVPPAVVACSSTTIGSIHTYSMVRWRSTALILGLVTHGCVSFVPAFFGGIARTPGTASSINRASFSHGSGGISSSCHVSSSQANLHRSASSAGPLMMAKGKKKGKGKAGRLELIERCGTGESWNCSRLEIRRGSKHTSTSSVHSQHMTHKINLH